MKVNILSPLSAESCAQRLRKRLWWLTPLWADFSYYGTKSKNPIGTHIHVHTYGAEMFQQFLCPFPDPHLQELTAPSVPCEKPLNASRMAPVSTDFAHLPLEGFCSFSVCLGGRAWAKRQTVIHVGSCYNGKGKMNHLNPFSQPLLFPWETTETAAFGPLIIHKPVYSFIDINACCNHCKFKCAKRSGKFKPD